MVLKQLADGRFVFWCPACNDNHVFESPETAYASPDRPTFAQSVYDWDTKNVCHSQIRHGKLYFLPDSTHDMRQRWVEMPDLPWFMVDEPEAAAYVARDSFYYPELDEEEVD